MRRAGKTTFLHQCLAQRHGAGVERERLVYFNFEDERLDRFDPADLGALLDTYYRDFPQFRRAARVTWCLDEIQVVRGWEKFVRRMLDAENVEVLLSGSSARMLSREVSTSMCGRALESVITPFSFVEFARAHGLKPPSGALAGSRVESEWLGLFDRYLEIGGFPLGEQSRRIEPREPSRDSARATSSWPVNDRLSCAQAMTPVRKNATQGSQVPRVLTASRRSTSSCRCRSKYALMKSSGSDSRLCSHKSSGINRRPTQPFPSRNGSIASSW
jgi:hypothetical protein